ncbi:MAG: hypothetical protein K8S87_01205 [Planctomycetes bacterium]|nr:hypothetical protein [Planctomycetota bacterium]
MSNESRFGRESKNVYSGFILFVVLIALIAALTIYVLNHNKIFSEVLYEQKLSELNEKSTITITLQGNTLTVNARFTTKMRIHIASDSYEFTLSEGENKLAFALYDSPECMLSINNLQNKKQNYLHKIPEKSTFTLNLPSEIYINMQNKLESLILGVINSGTVKSLIHAEFSRIEATDEN